MDSRSPWPIPLLILMGSEEWSSNFRYVILSSSILAKNSTYLLGMRLFHRLCTSLAGMAFGKAPSTSKDSTDTTLPCLHLVLILYVSRCNASVVVWPGLPLKWCE